MLFRSTGNLDDALEHVSAHYSRSAREAVADLQAIGMPAQVGTTVTRANVEELPQMVPLLARYGVAVLESEIVGLVPQAALLASAAWDLQLEGFSDDQVLEKKLQG